MLLLKTDESGALSPSLKAADSTVVVQNSSLGHPSCFSSSVVWRSRAAEPQSFRSSAPQMPLAPPP